VPYTNNATARLIANKNNSQVSYCNYYKQAFQKCHHDIKKTWKLVNEIIAIKNKSQQNHKLFEDSECQKQCEDLNNFFSGVPNSY